MKKYRIKGSLLVIKANSFPQAIERLVAPRGEWTYTPHWYTRTNRPSWAKVTTSYGYECVVEEVRQPQ